MSIVAAIRKMMERGLSLEAALVAAEAFEEAQQGAKSSGAERTRRYRERKNASHVTVCDGCDVTGVTVTDGPSPPEEKDPAPQKTLTPSTPSPSPPLRGAHGSSPQPALLVLDGGSDPIAEALAAYNVAAKAVGWPVAQVLNGRRRSALKARLADCGGFEGWQAAMAKAVGSPFLCGENDRGWLPDLDFFLQAKSFVKLMEGGYDRRTSALNTGSPGIPARPSAARSIVGGFAQALAKHPGSDFGRQARAASFAGADDD